MLTVQKAGYHGIRLPDLDIGLDLKSPKAQYIFTSHAHGDHMPYNGNMEVYASPATVDLMRARGYKGRATKLPFGEPLDLPNAQVTLYPAGHILGSAMIFVESDDGNVLYTGDYRTPPSPVSEGFELPNVQVDQLITEATFALPIYKWKSLEDLTDQVQSFAQKWLSRDETPVFLAYNLGKAQEVMHMLAPLGNRLQIHGAGHKLCPVYEQYGFDLGNYEAYDRETVDGSILVTPSSAIGQGIASNVHDKRYAYCSGWATHESRRSQLTVDALIPLSDHLDFFALLELCEQLEPKQTYITHTPNPDVVQHYLEQKGLRTRFLDMEVEEHD
jgi:putative mRNA 3-end processing factor